MSDRSGIGWTESTWNPVTGCTKVSPGCDHCYAETLAERFRGVAGNYFAGGFDLQLRPDKLDLPLRWRKPRKVFVNSMSDLFHDDVPDEYIRQVFDVMAEAGQHLFQLLTKRHGRMRSYLSKREPLPNVWVGVSVEDQHWADIRIPVLRDTPAAVRWLSAEPLLGSIDLCGLLDGIGWVVVGGESGRGARRMAPEWARSLRDQCAEAGVPFFMKQAGAVLGREWRLPPGKGADATLWPEHFPQDFPARMSA